MPSRTSGAAAVDEAGLFSAVLEGFARDLVVVGFVGLAEVGGVGVGEGALLLHPVKRGAGVEPAGEGYADFLAEGQGFEDYGHLMQTSMARPPENARTTFSAMVMILSMMPGCRDG